ncbi:hypothetical protein HDU97_001656 [Phlyctochytrium planicorne]|nr:hypothetical protein HDU97_001656 [Phlyctochytrium planicorne]
MTFSQQWPGNASQKSEGFGRSWHKLGGPSNSNVEMRKLEDSTLSTRTGTDIGSLEDQEVTRGGFAGWLQKNWRCKLITLIVMLLVVTTLIVFGWFFWPRFPTITVLSLKPDVNGTNGGNFQFSIPKSAGKNYNYVTIKLNLKMELSVYNPNIFDLELEDIGIEAFLEFNATEIAKGKKISEFDPPLAPIVGEPPQADPNYKQGTNALIGTSHSSNLVFPSKQNKTFVMDFMLSYTPDKNTGLLADNAFKELLGVCGMTLPRQRPAHITYNAKSVVGFFKNFGYKPTIPGNVNIKCPIDDDKLIMLQQYPKEHPGATAEEILLATQYKSK